MGDLPGWKETLSGGATEYSIGLKGKAKGNGKNEELLGPPCGARADERGLIALGPGKDAADECGLRGRMLEELLGAPGRAAADE